MKYCDLGVFIIFFKDTFYICLQNYKLKIKIQYVFYDIFNIVVKSLALLGEPHNRVV